MGQKRVLRALCGVEHRSSCKEHFISEKVLTVPSHYILACAKYVHSHPWEFKRIEEYHQYATRRGSNIRSPYHRTRHILLQCINLQSDTA